MIFGQNGASTDLLLRVYSNVNTYTDLVATGAIVGNTWQMMGFTIGTYFQNFAFTIYVVRRLLLC